MHTSESLVIDPSWREEPVVAFVGYVVGQPVEQYNVVVLSALNREAQLIAI
jgi:hypothetical protein